MGERVAVIASDGIQMFSRQAPVCDDKQRSFVLQITLVVDGADEGIELLDVRVSPEHDLPGSFTADKTKGDFVDAMNLFSPVPAGFVVVVAPADIFRNQLSGGLAVPCRKAVGPVNGKSRNRRSNARGDAESKNLTSAK